MGFMIIVYLLENGMTSCLAFRYSLEQSVERNEVSAYTSSNRWRSTQLFYMAAPVQLYSILCGIHETMLWRFQDVDISWWSSSDRGDTAIRLIKWWTLLLAIGPIPTWIYYIVFSHVYTNTLCGCMIVTIIGLDMLIPSTYLWLDDVKLSTVETK